MIIELAGLPGSGKTTIARQLGSDDPALRVVVVKPRLTALLRRPGAFLALGPLWPGAAWRAWAALCVRRAAQAGLAAPTGSTLLFEEGIAHHIWRQRFLHRGLDGRPWPRLIGLPAPLVVLVAPPSVRHSRVRGKAHGGIVNRQLAQGSPDDSAWQRAEDLMEEILEKAEQVRPVIRISTEGSVAEGVLRVAEAVRSLVTG